jgi:hypothetical protein
MGVHRVYAPRVLRQGRPPASPGRLLRQPPKGGMIRKRGEGVTVCPFLERLAALQQGREALWTDAPFAVAPLVGEPPRAGFLLEVPTPGPTSARAAPVGGRSRPGRDLLRERPGT